MKFLLVFPLAILLILASTVIFVKSDSACTRTRGRCQLTSIPCAGSYSTGKCNGPRNRQCCSPSVIEVPAADRACVSNGGKCVDWRTTTCLAGLARGMCGGDSNRRCCLKCDRGCIDTHQAFTSCCDSACTRNGRGKCQVNSNFCSGSYSSGKCGGPSNRQCCQGTSTGGNSCPLQTYSASNVVGYNGLVIRIEQGFKSAMDNINLFAKQCKVTVQVTHAFRKSGQSLSGTVVTPAKKSNHLVGHAIDMNLSTPKGWCNSGCLSARKNSDADCFIKKVISGGLRWGGSFGDPVHIDDHYNANVGAWNDLYQQLQASC